MLLHRRSAVRIALVVVVSIFFLLCLSGCNRSPEETTEPTPLPE